jgi:KUP system potassium uptake protein
MNPKPSKASTFSLALAAIGVVYGDIGTSVLYAFKEVFVGGEMAVTVTNIMGVLSLFFWTITLIVSFKYVCLILRADNEGEGGLVALLTLSIQQWTGSAAWRAGLLGVGLFGTALFYGDGVITPAISVLSAVEGLSLISNRFDQAVLPMSLLILWGLFSMQHRGTGNMGRYFSPVMLLWFGVMAYLGGVQIAHRPEVLLAMHPAHAWHFLSSQPKLSFMILSTVILCVSGAEALYADLGHFGQRPIQWAWFMLAMPCLILNYFGQGALLIQHPEAVTNPFYLMAPDWALEGLVILAVLATIIASQALITGAFSVSRQVIQLGYLPRLSIRHTSVQDAGQIYMPAVNWLLFVAIVLAVIMFKNSNALSEAYGVAICTDMLITTVLGFFVMRGSWAWPWWKATVVCAPLLVIDGAFWSSNITSKLAEGGWFPLTVGAMVMLLMTTWQKGSQRLQQAIVAKEDPAHTHTQTWLQNMPVSESSRVAGTAVYLCQQPEFLPHALWQNWQYNHVMHEQILLVSVQWHNLAHLPASRRIVSSDWGHGVWHIAVHYGYADVPDLPLALLQWNAQADGPQGVKLEIDPIQVHQDPRHQTTYFLSRNTVSVSRSAGLATWRKRFFAQMHWNESTAAEFLNLPIEAVVEMGRKVEI